MQARFIRIVLLTVAVGLTAACGEITPVDYTPIDEIKQGPGLFSGEDGEFTLYRR